MRKILVFENVTLDGFMAGPNGEIDWSIRDDEVTEFSNEGQDSTDGRALLWRRGVRRLTSSLVACLLLDCLLLRAVRSGAKPVGVMFRASA